jgi:hypothetical protein
MQCRKVCLPVPEGEGTTSAETSVDIYLSIQHDIPEEEEEEEGTTILRNTL